MQIKKAVITAAGREQRSLPLQTLIDRDGREKSVLAILSEQAFAAGVEEVCVVVWPGDASRYGEALGQLSGAVRFIDQPKPRGYADAIYCSRDFVGDDAFLHMVADHLCLGPATQGIASLLVELAQSEECAVSAVQSTRESLLPCFGAIGGARVPGQSGVYRIHTVLEKPTPTEAEQRLLVPGVRAGHYLCFMGVHVLTSDVMELLGRVVRETSDGGATLSSALAELARQKRYLAIETTGRRFDLAARYGMLNAQLAVALNGQDRDLVLCQLVELLADRGLPGVADGSMR